MQGWEARFIEDFLAAYPEVRRLMLEFMFSPASVGASPRLGYSLPAPAPLPRQAAAPPRPVLRLVSAPAPPATRRPKPRRSEQRQTNFFHLLEDLPEGP